MRRAQADVAHPLGDLVGIGAVAGHAAPMGEQGLHAVAHLAVVFEHRDDDAGERAGTARLGMLQHRRPRGRYLEAEARAAFRHRGQPHRDLHQVGKAAHDRESEAEAVRAVASALPTW